jgi:hypothetical protein
MRLPLALVLALFAAAALGCTTYRDDLVRGQTAFEQNNHERALALFRVLEPDTAHLTTPERAHYAYLRGMTDYRIGYRADARHWLLVAQSMELETPGVLPADWKTHLGETLGELNDAVYTDGIESLSNARKAKSEEPATSKKKKSEDEP